MVGGRATYESDGAIAIAGKGEKRDNISTSATTSDGAYPFATTKWHSQFMPVTVLRVFISTTANDLAAYRDHVHQALAETNVFQCVSQKTMGAQNSAAMEFCRKQIEAADLFVGLIGVRRGWEPADDPANRSITEMEHDWAQTAMRPRYLYVAPNSFKMPSDLRESDAKHDRQMAFRERILANGEIIVSQNGFESPESFAAEVVKQLLMERLLTLLDERGDLKRAEKGGLERETVLKLAKRLKPDDTLDFDRAIAELENAVHIALDAIASGKRGSNEDDFVSDVLKSVAAHTQAGENERATQELDDALKELDTHDAEQRETLKRSRLTLLEAGIAQDLLRRDAKAAAQRIARIAEIEHPDDSAQRFNIFQRRWQTFRDEGRDKGLNLSLEAAIEIARAELGVADTADRRGAALNDLGIALHELGERESGTGRLDEAIAAFREALKEWTHERRPLNWATTQNNLGNTLAILGARESGTARLDEAVAAFREALKEYTRERLPIQWAATQNNLGGVLQTLGAREGGTARLDEAVAAYREALEEQTRERVPLDWALTQNNLGNALATLGERESGTARLEEAVAAYREALKERTRERVPLDWAMTQHNLGAALRPLGARESGTARLDEAVAAYREALKEYTRERTPLQWATTQNNLGNALLALGAREGETTRFDEAIAAYREALKERTRERAPLSWAISTGSEGVALMHLADSRNDAAMAATALSQIEQSLAVTRDAGHVPFAEYFEAQLPQARSIRNRLQKT